MLARKFLIILVGCALLSSSCKTIERSLNPTKAPYKDVVEPGFFDVGAGFGVVKNTRPGDNNDASGVIVSLKAYPGGRWYGAPKDVEKDGLSERDRNDIVVLLTDSDANRINALKNSNADVMLAKTRLEALLKDRKIRISVPVTMALTKAIQPNKMDDADRKLLLKEAERKPSDSGKWRIIQERDSALNRISAFYGVSAGNIDNGGIDSTVNVFGVGFDITPDFALLLGRAFFEADNETDDAWFFGVSLNLYAFRDLISRAGDL